MRRLLVLSVYYDISTLLSNISKKGDLQIPPGIINHSKQKIDFSYLLALRDHKTKTSNKLVKMAMCC